MLPWQQHCRCHSFSFAMYIAGAKFKENCFKTPTVIRDGVLCCFSGTTYEVITFLICIMGKREYLQNEKKIIQKGKSLSNKQQYVFLLHRHFKHDNAVCL